MDDFFDFFSETDIFFCDKKWILKNHGHANYIAYTVSDVYTVESVRHLFCVGYEIISQLKNQPQSTRHHPIL